MRRLFVLLQIVALCSVLSLAAEPEKGGKEIAGSKPEQKQPVAKSPVVPVLNEAPQNIISIGDAGKYYCSENVFQGNAADAVKVLIIRVRELEAQINELYRILGQKQAQLEVGK